MTWLIAITALLCTFIVGFFTGVFYVAWRDGWFARRTDVSDDLYE